MGEPVVAVVDPVAGEPAGADERVLGPAVGVQGQGQRRPHQWRLPLHEGSPAHPPGCRDAGAPAARLDEADPAVAELGLALDVGQLHGLEAVLHGAAG